MRAGQKGVGNSLAIPWLPCCGAFLRLCGIYICKATLAGLWLALLLGLGLMLALVLGLGLGLSLPLWLVLSLGLGLGLSLGLETRPAFYAQNPCLTKKHARFAANMRNEVFTMSIRCSSKHSMEYIIVGQTTVNSWPW